MNGTVEAQILDAENRLRTAMLGSDTATLEDLLAPDLIFTNHLGQLVGKEEDIADYRSGMLKVKDLKPSEQQIRIHGDVAIVSVRMQVFGIYDGTPLNSYFRFTRVWALSPDGTWHVVAAHTGIAADSK